MSRISSAPKEDRARQTAVLSWEHLEALSTEQLVELHNSSVAEAFAVRKFPSKKVAVRRTWQAICRHKAQLAEGRRAAQKANAALEDPRNKRSVSSRHMWTDPVIRNRILTRLRIVANGEEYSSVVRAFRDLQLEPFRAHADLRIRLRAQGAATFTSEDGRVVNFKAQVIAPPKPERKL